MSLDPLDSCKAVPSSSFLLTPGVSKDLFNSWLQSTERKEFIESHPEIFTSLDVETLQKIPSNSWLSALVFALEFPAILDRVLWETQYRQLTVEETHKVLSYIFDHPELLLALDLGSAHGLSIKPWGGAYHNFHKLCLDLMEKEGNSANDLALRFSDSAGLEIKNIYETHVAWSSLERTDVDFTAGKVLRVLGRTVLFQPNESEKIIACKFRRKGESLSEFCREKEITDIFRCHTQFRSRLPVPVSVFAPLSLPVSLLPENIETKFPALYLQEVEEDYYYYLHEIDDDDIWSESRAKFLYDSGIQLSLGQMPPFVEFFHNEECVRKYQPLANLIPNNDRGAGRLETPFEKSRFPNAGAWGARDLGDGLHISEAYKDPGLETLDLFKLKKGRAHYLLMNGLSKLLLVDSVLLLHRLKLQERINWEDKETIDVVAYWLQEGMVEAISGYCGKSQSECMAFINCLPINWKRQAVQIMFWSQDDERGYPGHLEAGRLPDGLYDDDMPVDIDLAEAKNYVPGKGFLHQGRLDIGCYNGPLGWVECEKGWYWASAFAASVNLANKVHIDFQRPERKIRRRALNAGKTRRKLIFQ